MHLIYFLGENGPTRFGELQRALTGISAKVLTRRLRDFETGHLLWREQTNDRPPQVTYGLTDLGGEVHGALKHLDAPAHRLVTLQGLGKPT